MLPFATTTITVFRPVPEDLDDEPYSGERDRFTSAHDGVRAVIDPPTGRDQVAGGEQDIWDSLLNCDPIDLHRLDEVMDETTTARYRVVWVWTIAGDHTEAGLRIVQGEA